MLKRVYRISDEGSWNILKSGLYMCLFNLATLLPVLLLAMVADEMMNRYFGIAHGSIPLWGYWGTAFLLLCAIYFAYRMTYRKKYLTSTQEDMRLRMGIADKIRRLPLSYIGRRDLSDLASTVMDDVAAVELALSTGAAEFIGGFLSGVTTLAILAFYNWKLAGSLAVCLPLVVIVMFLCRIISEGTNQRNRQKKLDISDGLQEYLETIKVLRSSEEMEGYQNRLSVTIKRILKGLVLYEFLSGFAIGLAHNIMRIGLGLIIVTGSTLLISGEIHFFAFLLFLLVAVRIYEPLTKACESLGVMISSLVSAGRIRDLMDYPEQQGDASWQPKSFDIFFDHVSFAYNKKDVLHDVSFTAKQGQITALVGPSGCGKSTLCRLAARFWDVSRGSVSLGGLNLNEIAPDTLLKHYAFVFQDVVLFNDTIYNNIKIGKENATREEVLTAAKLACCDEFIARLPQGYDTVIGENGMTLSGGERQRLSIARAFLKDAPVI
ncbi:MAG: ABC transporter ATP-binding protein, partial [Mitsuokella sp.]